MRSKAWSSKVKTSTKDILESLGLSSQRCLSFNTVKKILDPDGYAKSKRRETKEMNKLDQDFLF